VNINGAAVGGAGGAGGKSGSLFGNGGAGGTGGAAISAVGALGTVTNVGSIVGGAGGVGGVTATGVGGTGGAGGAGLSAIAGGTIVNSGAIKGGAGGLGASGSASGNGGAAIVGSGLTITNSGAIAGGAAGGAGGSAGVALDLSGTNRLITLGAGALSGDIRANGGTLTLDQTVAGAGNAAYANKIVDTAGNLNVVVDAGANAVTLSNAANNQFQTQVKSGTLSVANAGALGGGDLSLVAGGVTAPAFQLAAGASAQFLTQNVKIDPGVSGTIGAGAGSTLTIAPGAGKQLSLQGGAGTTAHFGSATNTGTVVLAPTLATVASAGAASVDGGTLRLGNAQSAGAVSGLQGGLNVGKDATTAATLDTYSFSFTANNLTGSSKGVITNNGGGLATVTTNNSVDTTYSGVIQDGVAGQVGINVKTSGGVLTLAGANTYGGPTIIDSAATLKAGTANAFSQKSTTSVLGKLDLNGFNQTIDTIYLAGGRIRNGTLTSTDIAVSSFGGIISVGGAVESISGSTGLRLTAGTTNLEGANTYSGATLVDGATLRLNSAKGLSANSALTVNWGGTFDLNGFNATVSGVGGQGTVTTNGAASKLTFGLGADSTFVGQMRDGAGQLSAQVSGGKTLTVTGQNIYSGTTQIDAGSGLAVAAGGAIGTAANHAGAINVDGALLIKTGGTVDAGTNNLTNQGTVTIEAGGRLTDDLVNNGVVNNSGLVAANLQNNAAGTVTNKAPTGVWQGNVVANKGTIVNEAGANWIGNVNAGANTGSIDNRGAWTGNVGNNLGQLKNGGTITGTVANSGAFDNLSGGVVSGLLTQAAGTTTNAGALNGGASVTGGLLTNNNQIIGAVAVTGGRLDNNATISGSVDNSATFNNYAGGNVTGGLKTSGTATNAVGATISGGVAVTAGTFTTKGVVNGGLTNSGTTQAQGAINGIVKNLAGSFNVTGDLKTDSVQNSAGATVDISKGTVSGASSSLTVDNAGLIIVRASATLTALGGVTNSGAISVLVGGKVNDALTNTGSVFNSGIYNGDLINSGAAATVTNLTTGQWTGNVLSNSAGAKIVNQGAWFGSVSNTGGSITSASTWIGNAVNSSGTIANGGVWVGALTNDVAGTFQNLFASSTLTGLLTTSGTATNAGVLDGGALVLAGTLTSTGTINNGATVTGGTLTTSGTVNGGLVNGVAGTVFASGAINGQIDNSGKFTLNGALANNGSTVNNNAGATLDVNSRSFTNIGALNNNGAITIAGGSLAVNGTLTQAAGSIQNIGGAIAANAINETGGLITNSGTIGATTTFAVNGGVLTNNAGGVVTAAALTVGAGGTINNNATITSAAAIQNAGLVNNNNGGTLNGGLVNTGTLNNNAGAILNGGLTNSATATNGGSVNGGVANSGSFTTTGAVTGGLVNAAAGVTKAAGSIAGGVTNTGSFTVTGALANGAGNFANNGAGTLFVTGGDYANIATLTNSSTAATGVSVSAGRTLSAANVTNTAGATIANFGALASANVIQNAGTLNNSGAVTGGLNNAGAFNQLAGSLTGGLTNSGTANVTGSLAGGVTNTGSFTVTGALVNGAGSFANNGAGTLFVTGGDYTNIGAFVNSSTAATGVSIAAGRTLSASGVANSAGATIVNAGTLASTGAAIQNAGTLTSTGALTGGLNNTNLANAAGSIAGGVANTGTFTVTGALANGGGDFANGGAGTLAVSGGDYTGVGALTNSSTAATGVTIASGRTLSATSATNSAGSTIAIFGGALLTTNGFVNQGKVNAAGTIGGGVTNTGTFNVTAALANNGGKFDNNGNGALIVGAGDYTNIGVLTNSSVGDATAGAQFQGIGVSLGHGRTLGATSVVNNATIALGDRTTNSTVNSIIAGNLTNNGTLDLAAANQVVANGATAAALANSLTVNGNYTGGGVLNVAARFADLGGQRAGELLVNGAGAGNVTTVIVNPFQNQTGFFASPILIAKTNPGSTSTFQLGNATTSIGAAQALNTGLVSFNLQQLTPGQWYLVPNLDTGSLSAIGGSVASAVASATTGFFQSASAFVQSHPDAKPNAVDFGIWTRAAVGRSDLASSSSAPTAAGGTAITNEKTRTLYSGYQVGLDASLSNIENTQINLHGGVMAGQYLSNSYDLLGSGTRTRFDVPFVGVYAVATGFGFFADVQFRHDFWNADITNYRAGLNEKPLEGRGWAGSASLGYHWDLPNDWFIEPSAAINVTSVDFDRLQVAAGTTPAYLVLDTVRSTLGRVGLRAGTSFVLDNKYAFQPFASVSGWNEFETSLKESFQQNVTYVPISVSRSGAFAQFGLGVSAQIIDTGWVGFVRGDYRTGEKLTGAALNGGVSYRF
jgi:hypothetical protein